MAFHHAGAEVLDQHVGLRGETPDERRARLLADVDGHAALVAVESLEVEATHLRRQAAGSVGVANPIAAAGLLHLDDVGAEVAEQRRAPWTGRLVAQVDHADAGEGRAAVARTAHQNSSLAGTRPPVSRVSCVRSTGQRPMARAA